MMELGRPRVVYCGGDRGARVPPLREYLAATWDSPWPRGVASSHRCMEKQAMAGIVSLDGGSTPCASGG